MTALVFINTCASVIIPAISIELERQSYGGLSKVSTDFKYLKFQISNSITPFMKFIRLSTVSVPSSTEINDGYMTFNNIISVGDLFYSIRKNKSQI